LTWLTITKNITSKAKRREDAPKRIAIAVAIGSAVIAIAAATWIAISALAASAIAAPAFD
jgi:hypothetical protein